MYVEFRDMIPTPSGSSGLLQGWRTPLTIYLVFLWAVAMFVVSKLNIAGT